MILASQYPVHGAVQSDIAATLEAFGGRQRIELGQPLFLNLALSNNSGVPVSIGIDANAFTGASWLLEVSRDGKEYERVQLDELVARRLRTVKEVEIPARGSVTSALAVWFRARTRVMVEPRPRPLVFDKVGQWFVRVRLFQLSLDPEARAAHMQEQGHAPLWDVLVTEPIVIDVVDSTREAEQFVDEVGVIIWDHQIVEPTDRATLQNWVDNGDAWVRDCAQWLMLRSFTVDRDWWDGIERQSKGSLQQLQAVLPLAIHFQDREYIGSPMHYDSCMAIAADNLIRGEHKEGAAMLLRVHKSYGNTNVPHLAWARRQVDSELD